MMQRAVLRSAGCFEIQDAPTPSPAPGEALVRVTAVGVCGSDLHMFKEGQIGGIRLEDAPSPLVPGHEVAGVVEQVGAGVAPSLVGRRVAVEPAIHCGACGWCLSGRPNVCPHHVFLGLPPRDGAMQTYLAHPARLCVPVPEPLGDDETVMLEPLAIAVHALERACFQPGQAALVLGAGPIGLSVLMLLADAGAAPILVSDRLDDRLALARELGATHTLNPLRDDVVSAVRGLTDGAGAPTVFEAAGDPQTFEQMVECAAPAACVAVLGIPAEDRLAFQHSVARRKGLDIHMVRRSNRTLPRAIEWTLRRKLPLAKLVRHHFPLGRSQEAYRLAADYADGAVKVIVNP